MTRKLGLFYPILVAWVGLFSASTVILLVTGSTGWVSTNQWLLTWGAMAALTAAAVVALRERVVYMVVLVPVGMLVAQVGMVVTARNPLAVAAPDVEVENVSRTGTGPAHVIHIVFDEQIGLAGFPSDIAECVTAAQVWRDVLARHGFVVYPRAFSNYDVTWNSLPSIMNDRLLDRPLQHQSQDSVLNSNERFAQAIRKGMDLALYQSEFLRFDASVFPATIVRTYDTSDLTALTVAPASWTERAERIAFTYFVRDKPMELAYASIRDRLDSAVGPLALRGVLVRRVADDILKARRPTLFFAHLLEPHFPYVYAQDGSVRPLRTWTYKIHGLSPSEYVERYREYAGQSIAVANELDAFLGVLQAAGVLETSTVIVHGDHGSRIVHADNSTPLAEWSDRDRVSAFSTLFAHRVPGQARFRADDTQASVLALLRHTEHRPSRGDDATLNQVFRMASYGRFDTPAPMLQKWR
ncbi:MAG: hypothetical protein ABL993_09960 [Vicinamibacterales bacterium]